MGFMVLWSSAGKCDAFCEQSKVLKLLELWAPKDVLGGVLERIGNPNGGGGYIMLHEFPDGSVCYSFGIPIDNSWNTCISEKNVDVFLFDNFPNECFSSSRIRSNNGGNTNSELKKLLQLMKQNGHENEQFMILKVDIGGAEWDILANIPTEIMMHFNQMIIIFYDVHHVDNPPIQQKMVRVLEKINTTHQAVHVHGDNSAECKIVSGVLLPDVLEVTYVRKAGHDFEGTAKWLPVEGLDKANDSRKADLCLGSWGVLNAKKREMDGRYGEDEMVTCEF
jgi:hypothetical protein